MYNNNETVQTVEEIAAVKMFDNRINFLLGFRLCNRDLIVYGVEDRKATEQK